MHDIEYNPSLPLAMNAALYTHPCFTSLVTLTWAPVGHAQPHHKPPLCIVNCTSHRFVARSGVTRLKRYQIDRIFHTGTQRSPKEAMEADFDIVFSSFHHSSTSVRSTTTGSGNSSTLTEFQRGLDNGRGGSIGGSGGGGSGAFEMAEAEAVLVISQVRQINGTYSVY